ncbi:MAG: hypothetical protein ACOY3K_06030 [Candidatus Omnitrophota bacterium]
MRHGRYDEDRDRKIFSRAWEGKNWRIIVGVYSYEGTRPRLQLSREKIGKKFQNRPYAKLGRLSKDEVEGILPILQEALHHM